jgi:hypothetical protein
MPGVAPQAGLGGHPVGVQGKERCLRAGTRRCEVRAWLGPEEGGCSGKGSGAGVAASGAGPGAWRGISRNDASLLRIPPYGTKVQYAGRYVFKHGPIPFCAAASPPVSGHPLCSERFTGIASPDLAGIVASRDRDEPGRAMQPIHRAGYRRFENVGSGTWSQRGSRRGNGNPVAKEAAFCEREPSRRGLWRTP